MIRRLPYLVVANPPGIQQTLDVERCTHSFAATWSMEKFYPIVFDSPDFPSSGQRVLIGEKR